MLQSDFEKSINKMHEYLVRCQNELIEILAAYKGMASGKITAPFDANIENTETYTRIVFNTPAPKIKWFVDSSSWRDMFYAAIMEAALTQPVRRYKDAVMVVNVYTSSKILWDLDHFPMTALVNALKLSNIIQDDNYSMLSIAVEGIKSNEDKIEVFIKEKGNRKLSDIIISG